MKPEKEPLVEIKSVIDEDYFVTDVLVSAGIGDSAADYQQALELARVDVDEAVKAEVGEEAFAVIEDTLDNSVKYDGAERSLLQKMRRSRIAMLGFGALAALSLGKSAQHFADSEFTMFEPNVPSSMAYRNPQECYDDPAGTQLLIHGIWREVEPGDDASTSNCLTNLADKIESDLQESRSYKSVAPDAEKVEALVDHIRVEAGQVGDTASRELVSKHDAVQESITSRHDGQVSNTLTGLVYVLLGTPLSLSALSQRDNYRDRKRALGLLRELRPYAYGDVQAAVTAESRRENTQLPESYTVSVTGSEEQKELVLLPHLYAHKGGTNNFQRRCALHELRDVLSESKDATIPD